MKFTKHTEAWVYNDSSASNTPSRDGAGDKAQRSKPKAFPNASKGAGEYVQPIKSYGEDESGNSAFAILKRLVKSITTSCWLPAWQLSERDIVNVEQTRTRLGN